MVLSSVEVCMDSVDWTQSFCTNLCKPVLPPPEEMMPPCPNRPQAPPPLMPERRSKPQPEQALKCPRCDSTNTKFCYYNNYNLSQPRHFCKACRRYWTKGGALRNVPVGGGCRKNKRAKKTATPADAPAITNEASTSAPSATTQDLANCSTTYESTLPVPPPDSLYFTSNSLSLTGIPFTRLPQDTAPPPFLCSEALGNLNPFKTTNPALDFSATMAAADQNSLFQSQPGISRSLASTLFIDTDSDLSWKLQQQQNQQPPKLCFPLEEGGQVNGSEPQDFLTFDQQAAAVDNPSSSDHKSDVLKMLPPCAVKEEPNASLTSDWQVPAPESLFAGDSTSYWNGGGWPDISSFTSITQLL